jgi:hypothetical protein
MFSSGEMDKASTRIAQVVALEEIGRSVRAAESNRRWPPGEVVVTGV